MTLIVLIVVAAVLMIFMVGIGTFWVLVQLGVIARKAMEPPIEDRGSYSIDQGRDVGAENGEQRV